MNYKNIYVHTSLQKKSKLRKTKLVTIFDPICPPKSKLIDTRTTLMHPITAVTFLLFFRLQKEICEIIQPIMTYNMPLV